MKALQKTKQNFFRVAALALSGVLLLTGCSMTSGKIKEKIGEATIANTSYSDAQKHVMDSEHFIYVTQSGLVELYLDTKNYGVCVKDTNTGKFWTGLPLEAPTATDSAAAMLSLSALKDGTRYLLNSQDHSVAFESASFKPIEDGMEVTYDLALDAKTANSHFSDLPADALYISVPIRYTLKDGTFYVSIQKQDIVTTPGCTIEWIELLPYFGATASDSSEDYIFVPDGSGAVSYLHATSKDSVKTFVPYGVDLALPQPEQNIKPARVAAYGMKSADSAFLAWVESGATACEISTYSKTEKEPFYRVGTRFFVQNIAYTGKSDKKVQHVSEQRSGELKLCYRFLSHNNAGYSGMASACRELLIRRGILSTKSVEVTEHFPLLLNAEATAPKKHGGGAKVLTSFEEMEELLSMMKAKGMDNVFVRYNGVLQGSLRQNALAGCDLIDRLGSKKDLNALLSYAKTQQFSLFLNLNLFSFKDAPKCATSLVGESIKVSKENPFFAFSGKDQYTLELSALQKIDKGVDRFVNGKNDERFTGYCIEDAGKFLYSDYGQGYNRLEATDILAKQAATLSAGHKLMVDTGNVYMLKNADVIANLPSTTGYEPTEFYRPVPFLQMIFHGILDYAHEAINLSQNSESAFLKSVEYGAIPSYTWYYEKTGIEELDSQYHFEKQINKAAENYAKVSVALNDLRDARMTKHGKVQNNVYFTEYNNNILLYFNYNDVPVTVNSITIAPMSFLRIN